MRYLWLRNGTECIKKDPSFKVSKPKVLTLIFGFQKNALKAAWVFLLYAFLWMSLETASLRETSGHFHPRRSTQFLGSGCSEKWTGCGNSGRLSQPLIQACALEPALRRPGGGGTGTCSVLMLPSNGGRENSSCSSIVSLRVILTRQLRGSSRSLQRQYKVINEQSPRSEGPCTNANEQINCH